MEETIKGKLSEQLKPEFLEVKDLSNCGCGDKFDVLIVSEAFTGKPLLQRHRLVNTTLSEEIAQIHALTMKTYTPQQWSEMNKTT